MIKNNETISIGWIDNQITEGGFTFGLLETVISSFFFFRKTNKWYISYSWIKHIKTTSIVN